MQGVRLLTDLPFAEVLCEHLEGLSLDFLLIDVQSGPFSITHLENWDALDAELSGRGVDLPTESSSSLWRPGTLARFAKLLVHDEWSYLNFLPGPEAKAVEAAHAIASTEYLSRDFFSVVEERVRLFAVFANEWWEVYSKCERLTDSLARSFPSAPVFSDHWEQDSG